MHGGFPRFNYSALLVGGLSDIVVDGVDTFAEKTL
jgi:hypothetical protein